MNYTITFKHSGFMGDIIYSLPAIKHICEETNLIADLYVFLDKTWENFEDVGRDHKGLIDTKGLNFIAPLLQALPYINKVAMWKGEKIAVDLDRVKAMGQQIGLPHSHISRWYGYAYPELSTDKIHQRTIDLLDVPHDRMPCSPYVMRLGRAGAMTYDDAESLGIDNVDTRYMDNIEIFHYGFIRDWRVMKSKVINMQVGVFGMAEYDKRLDTSEVFNPLAFFEPKDLKKHGMTHPKYINEWLEKHKEQYELYNNI